MQHNGWEDWKNLRRGTTSHACATMQREKYYSISWSNEKKKFCKANCSKYIACGYIAKDLSHERIDCVADIISKNS